MSADQRQTQLKRIRWVSSGFMGIALILSFVVVYWQVGSGETPPGWDVVHAEEYRTRGSVYDQGGHYLAVDDVVYKFYAYTEQITVTKDSVTGTLALARSLAPLVDFTVNELVSGLDDRNSYQFVLDPMMSDETKRMIETAGLSGLRFDPYYIRYYPEGDLFGPLVGLTRWLSSTGISGLEAYYWSELTGRQPEGWESFSDPAGAIGQDPFMAAADRQAPSVELDSEGNPVVDRDSFPRVHDSADLHTTLDRKVQRIAYDALVEGVESCGAERGLVIVMEPRTGRIRAVANYPSFDPNRYPEYYPDRGDYLVNYAVTATYEPGSVIKTLTVAAAMNEGIITADTMFNDTGEITVGPKTIYNWDERAYGWVNTVEVLAYSLNVEAAQIAQMLQPAVFYDYFRRFGFGESTLIDLAGELTGELRVPGESAWNISDLGTNSFGQGFATTPMAVITAISVLANDGKRMQPHVVEKIVCDGEVSTREPRIACDGVVTPEIAREVAGMMAEAVEMHIPQAQVPGYTIAGKSGTSQVADTAGYHPTLTIASFAGFGPVENPRFSILVKLDYPATGEFGSVVAAPVFRSVAQQLFEYYGIPPSAQR